ncbi:MAG: dienelactone hydrolase family protein [Flavobacteriales bacterium]|nr:dienelactone hydrolase family protein [Flavobacteriales bacterium]
MQEHHLVIPKTARYFSSGELNSHTKEIWVICHGYAQLANFFLRKFDLLNAPHRYLVAPEGLHRFYQEGSAGRVVASWMTKEDRLNDIQDYVNFLDLLSESLLQQAPDAKIYVFGFSQGCATVSRWISLGKTRCEALILYAGVFPPDMNFDVSKEALSNTKVILANGDEDEFLSEKDWKLQSEELNNKGIRHELVRFNGKHAIYPEALNKILKAVF